MIGIDAPVQKVLCLLRPGDGQLVGAEKELNYHQISAASWKGLRNALAALGVKMGVSDALVLTSTFQRGDAASSQP